MATARDDFAVAGWQLRPMAQADLLRVAALERASYVFPWNDQIFADCLRVGYHCVVVETADGVSGYGVLSMGAGEAHVLNLCIAAEWRRRGIARGLLVALLVHARDRGVRDAFLEVRRSNRAAIALDQERGFEGGGTRGG
jgi:ribosomal-protein-alanine N-acetyltransferase